MARFCWVFLLSLLCLTSCQSRYEDGVRYHSDGRSRGSVGIVPVNVRADARLPWDLSMELTQAMEESINKCDDVYLSMDYPVPLAPEAWVKHDWQKGGNLRSLYPHSEFLVMVEILEHGYTDYQRQKIKPLYMDEGDTREVLSISARIQVLDIRGEQPVPVLQQIIPSNHMVPVVKRQVDYNENGWGSMGYKSTPVGVAHARLVRDIVDQVERYVGFSKG